MPPRGILCPQPFLPFSRDLDKLAAACRVKQNRKKENSKRATPIAAECLAARDGRGQGALASCEASATEPTGSRSTGSSELTEPRGSRSANRPESGRERLAAGGAPLGQHEPF